MHTRNSRNIDEIYMLHPDDTRYCHRLKVQLKEKLSEEMSFYQSNNQYPDVVTASDSIKEHTQPVQDTRKRHIQCKMQSTNGVSRL